MSKASLCPVCDGKGVVYGIGETGACPTTTCHGCGGRGWVEVSDSDYNPIKEFHWEYHDAKITVPEQDYNRCPDCGGDRNNPGGTGCRKGSHYGAYCSVS